MDNADISRQINLQKILQLHKETPLLAIGNVVASLPITFYLFNSNQSARLVTSWLISLYTINFLRWLFFRTLDTKTASPRRILAQEKGYYLFVFASGLTWGSLAFLFFNPNNMESFIYILGSLIILTGGALKSLSARPKIYTLYIVSMMTPLGIVMINSSTSFFIIMGLAMLLMTTTALLYSYSFHKTIHHTIVLEYKNSVLLQEMKQQSLQLQQQTEKALKANKDKSRFLASASHDLRQPLHAVNLFVENLSHKISTEEQKQDLNKISLGLESLDELFDSLLDISRLDAGVIAIHKTNFSLNDSLQKLAIEFSSELEQKKLSLTISSCDYTVNNDPLLFERIVRNLLSNAIRYTRQGAISITCQHGKNLYLYIKDTGIGISEENIKDVFSEFFQVGNSERNRNNGLGLGLSIVQRVSELLDLPIHIESKLGSGTTFRISLPIGSSDNLEKENPIPPSVIPRHNKLYNLKIMVIDNEQSILDGMQELILNWEAHFIGAGSSKEALQLIKDGVKPDFILSDYRLPGTMNGCELVKEILSSVKVPALIISGDTDPLVLTEVENNNLIMLNKPIKPAQLRVAISRLIK